MPLSGQVTAQFLTHFLSNFFTPSATILQDLYFTIYLFFALLNKKVLLYICCFEGFAPPPRKNSCICAWNTPSTSANWSENAISEKQEIIENTNFLFIEKHEKKSSKKKKKDFLLFQIIFVV